jgi:hypothetical protein
MKTKLKSREAVWEAAGVQNVTYLETDTPTSIGGGADRCGEIIQAAVDWGMKAVSAKTLDRYTKHGQQLVVGPDVEVPCAGGPCWYVCVEMCTVMIMVMMIMMMAVIICDDDDM